MHRGIAHIGRRTSGLAGSNCLDRRTHSGAVLLRALGFSPVARTSALSSLALTSSQPENPDQKHSRLQSQQSVVDRLLAMRSMKPYVPYESLPRLFETPDLLGNPRLSPLVTQIDSRLLAPFYNDIDGNNKMLTFFKTGKESDVSRSHYMRSFMPHCRPEAAGDSEWLGPSRLYYLNGSVGNITGLEDTGSLPWQSLANLLKRVFGPMGVTEFRDFYTHILPADIGRHLPHKDHLQSDTWKVDVRLSPNWTELLVLDEVDGRWYALRFPPGGSGFVIDSKLFTRFHAVRAGPSIQQSILAVFHKQGSTRDNIQQALAQAAADATPLALDYQQGPFKAFALPPAPTFHPRSQETVRVRVQSTTHRNMCLELLRNAVRAVDPSQPRLSLGRVTRAVIDRAVATLPSDVRADVRRTYERNIKLTQLANFGARRSTSAVKMGYVEGGKKLRTVIDDRWITISGATIVGESSLRFPEYDGTETTRLRFAWKGSGDRYRAAFSTESDSITARNLALLAKALNFDRAALNSFHVNLDIVNGDVIAGKTAAQLREHGLMLGVVHLPDELDHKTKRLSELERRELERLSSDKRITFKRPHGYPKHPLSAWNCYRQDRQQSAKQVFDNLSPLEKQAYQEKENADRLRYQTQISEWRSANINDERPKRPTPRWAFFIQDLSKSLKQSFDQLSEADRQVYEARADADRSRYQQQVSEWRVAHPKSTAVTAYEMFCSDVGVRLQQQHPDEYAGPEGSERCRRELKARWHQLGSSGRLEYERRAHPNAPRAETRTSRRKQPR